jgi:hypothetical protein
VEKITLTGAILVNDNERIPYTLVLTDSAGTLRGYSLTYNEPDEAKSNVVGKLNRKKKTLTFRETSIVYAHGTHPGDAMCLINASLDYVNNGKANVLTGTLTSAQADNTPCGKGLLLFMNKTELQRLFAQPKEKEDTEVVMKKKSEAAGTTTAATSPKTPEVTTERVRGMSNLNLETEKITAGVEKTYEWGTDTVILDMWDGGRTDGDRITIQLNGQTYLSGHTLNKNRKRLHLPILKGVVNTISIIADNEGSDPPNTANLLLTDGKIPHSVLAYNTEGQEATIKIIRKK